MSYFDKKPTTRFYQVRVAHPWRAWGRFWLTSDGSLSIMSDYGNYAYWWTHPGCEIRRFLANRDDDYYIANKFSEGQREYDDEETLKSVKREILRLRRDKSMSRDEARSEWDLIREHSNLSHQEDLTRWHDETTLGKYVGMVAELVHYGLPGQLQAFMKVIWPVFVECLQHELFREKARAQLGKTQLIAEPVEKPRQCFSMPCICRLEGKDPRYCKLNPYS